MRNFTICVSAVVKRYPELYAKYQTTKTDIVQDPRLSYSISWDQLNGVVMLYIECFRFCRIIFSSSALSLYILFQCRCYIARILYGGIVWWDCMVGLFGGIVWRDSIIVLGNFVLYCIGRQFAWPGFWVILLSNIQSTVTYRYKNHSMI